MRLISQTEEISRNCFQNRFVTAQGDGKEITEQTEITE